MSTLQSEGENHWMLTLQIEGDHICCHCSSTMIALQYTLLHRYIYKLCVELINARAECRS